MRMNWTHNLLKHTVCNCLRASGAPPLGFGHISHVVMYILRKEKPVGKLVDLKTHLDTVTALEWTIPEGPSDCITGDT